MSLKRDVVSSGVKPWFLSLAKKNSEPRTLMQEVYLESHRGKSSEPAGLHGLRKQVTEAKEGPLELRRKKSPEKEEGMVCVLGGGRERENTCV